MPYETLPEDNLLAFLQLESEFKKIFDEKSGETDNSNEYCHYAVDYMNTTLAAAQALDIDTLSGHAIISPTSNSFYDDFGQFRRDVENIVVQIRIVSARRNSAYSVGLGGDVKTKIHALVEKIRSAIEDSSASVDKKDKIFAILSLLSKEINKDRTKLQYFGDLARALASLSKEVEEEGAEPWWKWFKLAMGVVDDAKESEESLPAPKEIKKIESPRKQLPKPNLDDEIPF